MATNNKTMKTQFLIIGTLVSQFSWGSEKLISKEEYIDTWSPVAVNQMIESGIPASITLAQGILESGSGNSELARKGNNHFGIKCHGWEGATMFIDDDKKDECFRVYESAEQSFIDHSAFLKQYDRYAFLFTYESDDYKSWAKGLKKAGYATNPEYPQRLIKIIEDLGLDKYDEIKVPQTKALPSIVAVKSSNSIESNQHSVFVHTNKVKYVVAAKGDTYYKIAQEFGLHIRQLYRYNSFSSTKDCLEQGDLVYLQPKRRRNLFNKEQVVLEETMTIEEVSQKYAINEHSLKKLNDITDEPVISKGEKVTLR